MQKKEKEKLLNKKAELFKELEQNQGFIKGSLSRISRNKKRRSIAYYLTYKDENQKTHTKYITAQQLKEAQAGLKELKKVKGIINEISEINIDLLKAVRTNERD